MKVFCLSMGALAVVSADYVEERDPATLDTHADATRDEFGRFKGAVTTNYSPSKTLACCEEACTGADCKLGCSSWLGQSSLNWESEVRFLAANIARTP